VSLKTKRRKKMKKFLKIDGKEIETKLFRTLKAAQNYMAKHKHSEMIYYRAHEYYVSVS